MDYYKLMVESYKKHQEHPEDTKAFYDFLYYAMVAAKAECEFACNEKYDAYQQISQITDGVVRIFGHTYKKHE